MEKYVIMFKGGVETQEFFSIEIAEAFKKKGYRIYWYDLIVSEQSAHLLIRFYEAHKNDRFAAVTFNFSGIAGEDGLYGDNFENGSFWNDAKIPVYNIVVDHPLYYHKYMNLRPLKYTQLSIDRNHIKYLNRFFPDADTAGTDGFLPLGGTELNSGGRIMPDKRYLAMQDRPIDVIFTGNYTPIKYFDKYIADMDREYQDFYYELVNDAIENTDDLIENLAERKIRSELTCEEALKGNLVSDDELRSIMPNLMFVDLSVRFYYRAKVMQSLVDGGVKVHTYGAGWEYLECKHPENIISAGSVNSLECLEMISQSKISLNVMPWFKDGAHDRVFNTMLNGAVCLSDTSRYLSDEFTDDKDILFYRLKELDGLADRVNDLLKDTFKLTYIADNAYNRCVHRHTWNERAEKLIEIIDKQCFKVVE